MVNGTTYYEGGMVKIGLDHDLLIWNRYQSIDQVESFHLVPPWPPEVEKNLKNDHPKFLKNVFPNFPLFFEDLAKFWLQIQILRVFFL